MPSKLNLSQFEKLQTVQPQSNQKWPTFKEILRRLHAEGIYIHSEQLAEFFLAHGLPVDLCYVPDRLKERAVFINENYRGDMVCFNEGVSEEADEDFMQLS